MPPKPVSTKTLVKKFPLQIPRSGHNQDSNTSDMFHGIFHFILGFQEELGVAQRAERLFGEAVVQTREAS